jgi:hypothetical protein
MPAQTQIVDTPPVVNLTGIPCAFMVASAVTGNVTGMFLHLQVTIHHPDGDITYTDKLLADDGQNGVFDVSGLFESHIEGEFVFPEHETNLVIARPKMCLRFTVKTWESYYDVSDDFVDNSGSPVSEGNSYYMCKGGISEDDLAFGIDWWDYFTENNKFMCDLPGEKEVSPGSVEKLYWLARSSGTKNLVISYIDTEGNSGSLSISATVTAYVMNEICISPWIVELLSGKEIDSYTVKFADSEEIQYSVLRDYQEHEDFFLFENDFGGFDSLWCTGAGTGKLKLERLLYTRNRGNYFSATDRQKGNTRAVRNRTRISNTGYIDQEWLFWASSLLSSSEVFTYSGKNKLYPIQVTAENFLIIDDIREKPWEGSFEWQFSLNSKYRNLTAGISLNHILPPYWSKVSLYFFRKVGATLIDMKQGKTATIAGTNITFPTGSLFDFSVAVQWDNTLLSFYDSENPRTAPLSFLDGTGEFAEAATVNTHDRVFFNDYDGKLKHQKILEYSLPLTTEEQQVVVDWLGWYFSLWEDESVLTEDNNIITE